ncbi:MAG: NADH-quinone oxidoreductase subunit L [Anaerolineaceae bacterium]|nr:NADH-quinone oxidoreductase subunit L [Anaerolineaceae bacterium]
MNLVELPLINLSDPNTLPWLIPAGPLLAFFIITLLTNRGKWTPATDHAYGGHHPDYEGMDVPIVTDWSRIISITVGLSGVIAALLISLNLVGQALAIGAGTFGTGDNVFASSIAWMAAGDSPFRIGVMIDPLNLAMLVMVPIAVLCIFIYSIGYMAHDPRQSRFFALISLFSGAMLTLVVADNLLVLFVGWEVMGLCSYMLIGFWFEKESAYKAAIKAFTVTRVADVIMLLGIAYLYSVAGTLNFRDILFDPQKLEMLAGTPAIIFGSWGFSAAGLIGTLLIVGTIGKSAQFPLHVWLPDAMEGPTPVSAMIHAAAMVSAGIYAIIRMYPLFVGSGDAFGAADPHHGIFTQPLLLMAIVGSFTALFSATMAVAQNDVKAVLAYSTISQLGFMMAALGIGAYIAAAFHLITHAFFKALLFMASGSVIHAMEHGEHHVHEHHAHGHGDHHDEHDEEASHDMAEEHGVSGHAEPPFDPQDMRNMGGLSKKIPVTFYAFMAGGFSLAGFPLITAGFWSKDEILAEAWKGTTEGFGPHALVFFMLAIAAFLTAFYTMRQIGLTFWGKARTEEAEHAGLGGPRNIVSITMQLPLIILAFFALFAGFVGVPTDFPLFGSIFSPDHNFFHHLVIYALPYTDVFQVEAPPFNLLPVLTSFAVALGGIWLGWRMYWRKPLAAGEEDPMINILGRPVYMTLQNRYYMDQFYELILVRPSKWIAHQVNVFLDKGIIDGFLHFLARAFTWIGDLFKVLNMWLIDGVGDGIPRAIYNLGGWLRGSQTGRVQQYLLAVLVMVLVIGLFFALTAGSAVAVQ